MRIGTIILTVGTVAMLATTSVAATGAKDPMQLVLRKAGMPAGASYDTDTGIDTVTEGKLEAQGVDADAASYLGATYSKAKGLLKIGGTIYATTSVGNGKKTFAVVKKVRDAIWRSVGSGKARIRGLPSYGDQQFGRHDPAGNEGIGIMELLVRKGSVVWLLNVSVDHRPPLPTTTLLIELKRYAAKQKKRVASG